MIVARAPFKGTVAGNVLEHGTGAINIDGCRVGTESTRRPTGTEQFKEESGWNSNSLKNIIGGSDSGRWPANLIHDGSDEVLAGFPNGSARFFYCAKASKKERGEDNRHPTVKPIALMRYLCRLVTPPGGLVFDPFMGSGSTGMAAIQEGFEFIGCDIEKEYCEIAERRIENERKTSRQLLMEQII